MEKCVGRTRYFRAFVLLACLAMVGYGLPAMAQEEELTPEQQAAMEQSMEKSFEEEITVTGSLIPRPTTEAMSPVAILEPEEITYSGVTRLEDLIDPAAAGLPGPELDHRQRRLRHRDGGPARTWARSARWC